MILDSHVAVEIIFKRKARNGGFQLAGITYFHAPVCIITCEDCSNRQLRKTRRVSYCEGFTHLYLGEGVKVASATACHQILLLPSVPIRYCLDSFHPFTHYLIFLSYSFSSLRFPVSDYGALFVFSWNLALFIILYWNGFVLCTQPSKKKLRLCDLYLLTLLRIKMYLPWTTRPTIGLLLFSTLLARVKSEMFRKSTIALTSVV